MDVTFSQVLQLLNAGGLVALAGVLFLLHREAQKTYKGEQDASRQLFREEQAAERKLHADSLDKERSDCNRRHETIIATQQAIVSELQNNRHAIAALQTNKLLQDALDSENKKRNRGEKQA